MSERSENSTTTSSGSEAAATNAKTSSLHATMLNFVLEQRLAERLQHSPIQVWTEFLNKYHQTTAELGPIAQSPIGLMEIFVQTVLPAAACKSADHKSKVAEHCYYCFLRLCLKNWRNSSDLALVKVQTNTSEVRCAGICILKYNSLYAFSKIGILDWIGSTNCGHFAKQLE